MKEQSWFISFAYMKRTEGGASPEKCDFCRHLLSEYFYYARLYVPLINKRLWGISCQKCFDKRKGVIGPNIGYKYNRKTLQKIEEIHETTN